jgi:hypothetical protein
MCEKLGADFGDANFKNLFKNYGNIKSAKIRRFPDEYGERNYYSLSGFVTTNFGGRSFVLQMYTC